MVDKIIKYCERHGKTLEEFCVEINMSATTVYGWQKHSPILLYARRIAHHMGCPVEELIDGTESWYEELE